MTAGSNRLHSATSPYLLQHADNPVHWFEWGRAAFDEAVERDVPILLSVGYASCHWCHVMAHESFEDATTAAVMNELFVNIKVDREERPDIDAIYMAAVQAMNGHGGWPMTVFLTPQGHPFYAGTYFPPEDRSGLPSFRRVLQAIDEAWHDHRTDLEEQAGRLTQAVGVTAPEADSIHPEVLAASYEKIVTVADPVHGGFGAAPKFPQAPVLEYLLRISDKPWAPRASAVLTTALISMARGGIHDIVGGGFSRYSVDPRWLVPHFEKMLYDNAQLARLYLHAAVVNDRPEFTQVARSTLDYMLRDLGLEGGGFASGEDADSEGVEGRYYVFSRDEFDAAGGTAAVAAVLGVTTAGNFEGANIVHLARTNAEVAADHDLDPAALESDVQGVISALREVRSTRVRPSLDDKVVCAWNGLALRALADAGRVLGEPRYLVSAKNTADFLLENLRDEQGRLSRSWRDQRVSGPGFCDDYAALAVGLFALYAATAEPRWYHEAAATTRDMVDLFWDEDGGGFHATGRDAEELIARPKNLFDNPTPSDNALAAEALQHLVAYTADSDLRLKLERTLRVTSSVFDRHPLGAGHALSVLAVEQTRPWEVAIVGEDPERRAMGAVLDRTFRPDLFRAFGDGKADQGIPLLTGRGTIDDQPTAYVCRGFVCDAPVTAPEDLERLIG